MLVDDLWNGIRDTVALMEIHDQKEMLMSDIDKYRRALKPVSLRTRAVQGNVINICLD
jgi:hypothetical protein